MAFVPGYEYDVFVSYAHVNDEVVSSAKEGWVSTLVENLQVELDQGIGRREDYRLWMDEDLSRNVRFTPQIEEALRRTAILLVLLSPAYLASDWCQRERTLFLDLLREKKQSGGRVFVVHLDKTEPEDQPPEFDELLGFKFWEPDGRNRVRRLGWPSPSLEDKLYWQRLDDLSRALTAELKRLRAATDRVPGAPQRANGAPKVFLAEVTDDLDERREDVKRYLTQAHIDVLPERCYPRDPVLFRECLEQCLRQCGLFVQLFSRVVGKRSEELPRGYAGLQLETAQALGIQRIHWRDRSLDLAAVHDPDHLRLLNLETMLAVDWEEFKSEVKQRAFAKPVEPGDRPAEPFVFVDTEQQDRPLAQELCAALKRHGLASFLPRDKGEPSQIREDFEENLRHCGALIVVYGKTAVTWIRSRLRNALKTLAQRPRDQPLRALVVYEGPPEPKEDLDLSLPALRVLNGRNGLDEAGLVGLLEHMRPGSRP